MRKRIPRATKNRLKRIGDASLIAASRIGKGLLLIFAGLGIGLAWQMANPQIPAQIHGLASVACSRLMAETVEREHIPKSDDRLVQQP